MKINKNKETSHAIILNVEIYTLPSCRFSLQHSIVKLFSISVSIASENQARGVMFKSYIVKNLHYYEQKELWSLCLKDI